MRSMPVFSSESLLSTRQYCATARTPGYFYMFHIGDFVSSPLDAALRSAINDVPAFPSHLQHCLLSGPNRSGKTSLLLHYAHSLAVEGRSVLFICHKAKVEQVPPLLPQGVDSHDPALNNIHMRYLETAADLQKYAACMHLLEDFPQAVIVDDLSSFVDSRIQAGTDKRQVEAILAKLLAVLHDAISCATRKLMDAQGKPCHLLVSDVALDGNQSMHLLQRWLPLVLLIRGNGPDFTLSASARSVKTAGLSAAHAVEVLYTLTPFSGINVKAIQSSGH